MSTITVSTSATRTDGSSIASTDALTVNIYSQFGTEPAALIDTIPGVVPGSSVNYVYAPTAPGTYEITATETDSEGNVSAMSAAAQLVVAATLAPPNAPTVTVA
jgi:hypothetical protein